jgi:hypothetical protein
MKMVCMVSLSVSDDFFEKSLCAFSNNSRKKEFFAHENEPRLGGDGFGVNKFLFAAKNLNVRGGR